MTPDDRSLLDTLRRLTNGFQVSQAIHVAATLGLADLLRDGPRSVDDLAAATGTTASALNRLLRALASVGIFAYVDGRFGQTALSNYLRSDVTASLRAWAMRVGRPDHWRTWGELERSLRSGTSAFRELYGVTAWDWRAGVTDRCELVAGSFFETVPPGADAYILKSIIHDWDDAASLAILRSCRAAVPRTGRLLLVEHVLKPVN